MLELVIVLTPLICGFLLGGWVGMSNLALDLYEWFTGSGPA